MQRMASGNKAAPAVLVVDDDPDLVDLLSRFLSRQGMKILVASNGPQCLELVQSSPPIDVIVLDIMMPGMDGLQVCAALKGMESARAIPIILLTARDDVETHRLFSSPGFAARLDLCLDAGNQIASTCRLDDKFADT